MLSLSADQNIQDYSTYEDYIRNSTKLQHLLTRRRKRQMPKKTSNPTPSEAGSETGTDRRCSSNKRPHLAPHSQEQSFIDNYNYQSDYIPPSNYFQNDERDTGVRTNKMMKLKHAGLQFDHTSVHVGCHHNQPQLLNPEQFVQQSSQQTNKQQPQLQNLEKTLKRSNISNYNNLDIDDNSKQHLVKSISDLPVFITIEGFRVVSYSIGGEPYLCLPQLLQFLKQNFTIKRLIDKFEESVFTFSSATPKQVEGFIKSSVLPPNATSCPLIKRSDADKICLGLYEQCSKALRNDIFKLCSNFGEGGSKKGAYNLSPVTNSVNNSVDSQSSIQGFSQEAIKSETINVKNDQSDSKNICQITSYGNNKSENIDQLSPNSCNITSIDDNKLNRPVGALDISSKNQLCINHQQQQQQQSRSISIIRGTLDSKSSLAKSTSDSNDGDPIELRQTYLSANESFERSSKIDSDFIKKPLFESEAQNPILALARAITSTLIIRVYHKCFGKCLGLYYPSLLTNCNSKCIECANCKLMLSPRRFIGHTHGSKERDLCHWGFNSYNWRSYIRLSRKQTLNNLDDDELLIQFRTLLSVSNDGAYEIDDNDYEFDKQEVESENHSIYEDRIKETKVEQHVSSNVPSSRIEKKKYTANVSVTSMMTDKNVQNQAPASTSACDYLPAETSLAYNLLRNPPLYLPSPNEIDLLSVKPPLGIPLPSVSLPLTSDVIRPMYAHQDQPSRLHQHQQVVLHPPPSSRQLPLSSDAYYNFAWSPSASQAVPAQSSIYKSSKRSSSFSMSNANTNYWYPTRSTSVASPAAIFNTEQLTRQLQLDSETKREIYICNNLTSYLGDKGLSLGLTNDIVETTLSIVRGSKALF